MGMPMPHSSRSTSKVSWMDHCGDAGDGGHRDRPGRGASCDKREMRPPARYHAAVRYTLKAWRGVSHATSALRDRQCCIKQGTDVEVGLAACLFHTSTADRMPSVAALTVVLHIHAAERKCNAFGMLQRFAAHSNVFVPQCGAAEADDTSDFVLHTVQSKLAGHGTEVGDRRPHGSPQSPEDTRRVATLHTHMHTRAAMPVDR
eukprot:81988-Chlamydomonas_euryale.AAC.5